VCPPEATFWPFLPSGFLELRVGGYKKEYGRPSGVLSKKNYGSLLVFDFVGFPSPGSGGTQVFVYLD
jgi:hypothetical protein